MMPDDQSMTDDQKLDKLRGGKGQTHLGIGPAGENRSPELFPHPFGLTIVADRKRPPEKTKLSQT